MDEEIISRHRKEKKELQAKITGLKKSVPKGDRSRRNAVLKEIETLEKELAERQAAELKQLAASLEACTVSEPKSIATSVDNEHGSLSQPQQLSRAARRREKAAAKAKALTQAVEASNIKSTTSIAAAEYSQLEKALSARGLTMHRVPSDGDCLFASIAHQLAVLGLDSTLVDVCRRYGLALPEPGDPKSAVRSLRLLAAAVISKNEEDFLPFILSETDASSSEDAVELYCRSMEKAGTWGGQLEIQALATALEMPIEVIQSAGPVIKVGEQFSNATTSLVITYHRHAFSTGEHYNSCRLLQAT